MMLRSATQLRSWGVRSIEDIVGTVDDFLFNDNVWRIRFLVVDTGGWLPPRRKNGRRQADRQVLVPPAALGRAVGETGVFVILTSEQFRNSPGVLGYSTDPHLKSLKAILGSPLLGREGEIGRVEDALLDTETWEIRDLTIRLSDGHAERTVLVPASAIRGIDRGAAAFISELTRSQVAGAVPVAPARAVEENTEHRAAAHFNPVHDA